MKRFRILSFDFDFDSRVESRESREKVEGQALHLTYSTI